MSRGLVSLAASTGKFRANAVPQRICLVIPPSAFLLDERVFPSLGILKVAASLEQAGFTVEMLDLSGVENYGDVAEIHARASGARVFGLTTTTPQLPAAVRIAQRIRAVRPDVRLVLGGPHVTLVHSATKLERKAGRIGRAHAALERLHESFDVLVCGDGEVAVFASLAEDAPRVVDADDPKSGMFMDDAFYDSSPFPSRHLVDLPSYRYSIDGHAATSLIAQLGCPYGCGFCGGRNSRSLRVIRTRRTESIVREIEQLHREHGYTAFMFYDDELNVSPKMVELMNAITALQDQLGTEFRLRGFVKSELLTDEQAAAMHRAGFRWLLCGFEAASPRILSNMRKSATLDENTRALEIARRNGLRVKALMSIGHPGESDESVRSVRDWLLQVQPDDFDCTVITTYPGTPYYDEAVPHASQDGVWTYTCRDSGDRLHAFDVDFTEVAEYYKGDPDDGYRAYVFTDNLSPEDLIRLRDWVERDVRGRLGIAFNPARHATRYEHSMGQGDGLPSSLMRATQLVAAKPS